MEKQSNHEHELPNHGYGKLTMTVLDETVEFFVFKSLATLPGDSNDYFSVEVLDSVIYSNFLQEKTKDKLGLALTAEEYERDDKEVMISQ